MQRVGWPVMLLMDGFYAFVIASAAGNVFRVGFWPAFLVSAVLLPVVFIGLLFAFAKRRFVWTAKVRRDWNLADAVAGAPGTTRQAGGMLIWAAQGTSLDEMLEQAVDVARGRLAAAIGRDV